MKMIYGKEAVRTTLMAWPDYREQAEGREQEEPPGQSLLLLAADTMPLGKTAAGGIMAVSVCKANKITGWGESPSTSFPYLIDSETGEGRHKP